MSEEKGEMRKSGEILRIVGIILAMIGIFLFIATFFPQLYGLQLDVVFGYAGMVMLIVGSFVYVFANYLRIYKKYETFSFLKCLKEECKYKEIRDFRNGDFVFKETDRKCVSCQSSLYIYKIAHLPIKNYKTTEPVIKDKKMKEDKEKFITKTLIKCHEPECKFYKVRDFQDNDTIFQEIPSETCTNCLSQLYVDQIFYVTEEQFEKLMRKGKIAS